MADGYEVAGSVVFQAGVTPGQWGGVERSARVEIRRAAIAESKFLRASFAGVTSASVAPFCKNPVVKERVESRGHHTFGLRLSWDA